MGPVGLPEMAVIFVIALVLFWSEEAARVGQNVRNGDQPFSPCP
jgi:hypothetical protein